MGKNGTKPPVFGIVKDYINSHVGETVSIKEIFGAGALGRTAYACYLATLCKIGYTRLVSGAGYTDPEAKIQIVKALPIDYKSMDMKNEAKNLKNIL